MSARIDPASPWCRELRSGTVVMVSAVSGDVVIVIDPDGADSLDEANLSVVRMTGNEARWFADLLHRYARQNLSGHPMGTDRA